METRQNIAIIAGLGLVVVLVGVYFWFSKSQPVSSPGSPAVPSSPSIQPQYSTRTEVPKSIKVPEKGEEVKNENVAIPLETSPISYGAESQHRLFEIEASGNRFSPSEIAVNQGDIVSVNLKATGKNYDFTVPDYYVKETVGAGQVKNISFKALPDGRFIF